MVYFYKIYLTKEIIHFNLLLMRLVDFMTSIMNENVICKRTSSRILPWWEYKKAITCYWTHVNICSRANGFSVCTVTDITDIPLEIWGLKPGLVAPWQEKQRCRSYEACFITTKLRISRLCDDHCSQYVSIYLQKIMFSFLYQCCPTVKNQSV